MIVRSRARALVVLATTAGLAATGLAVAPAAEAGPPGHWTRLTTSTGIHTDTHPSLVRLGTKLEVVWNQQDGGLESVRSRGVSLVGKADATTHTVVSGWSSIANDPTVLSENGHLLVVIGGVRSASPSETYKGRLAYATVSNATTWSLGPELLTQTANAAGANGIAAVEDGGAPTVAAAVNGDDAITYNHGIPGGGSDLTTSASGGDPQATALARDSKTHAVWAAWYDGSTAHQGVWYQQIYPSKGPLRRAVGSYSAAGSVVPAQAVAMAARPGGGVYLAYAVGATPSSVTKIRVLKATASGSTFRDVTAHGASKIALSRSDRGTDLAGLVRRGEQERQSRAQQQGRIPVRWHGLGAGPDCKAGLLRGSDLDRGRKGSARRRRHSGRTEPRLSGALSHAALCAPGREAVEDVGEVVGRVAA